MTPRLTEIPDALLLRRSSGEQRRQRELIAWCDANGVRPSLLELDTERRRRLLAQNSADTPRSTPQHD